MLYRGIERGLSEECEESVHGEQESRARQHVGDNNQGKVRQAIKSLPGPESLPELHGTHDLLFLLLFVLPSAQPTHSMVSGYCPQLNDNQGVPSLAGGIWHMHVYIYLGSAESRLQSRETGDCQG